MKNLYAIYLRKSRADSEIENISLEDILARHEKILIELANKYNYEIGKIYREIVSGENISDRPVVQELLKDVENGIWSGVLVIEIERLARGDTIDQGKIVKCFKFSNTKIITPFKIYDPENEFDEEYFEFGLFMSRREYKTINRRLQRGKISSVSEGKFVGSISPYGYDKVKLKNEKGYTLVKNKEASVIKKIFELYVYKDYSICRIVDYLNSCDLKTRNNNMWSVSSVREILNNPVYIGKIRWNARKVVKKYNNGEIIKYRPRNKNYILVNGIHKGIVSVELWNLAQSKRISYKRDENNIKKLNNCLAGILICKNCGMKMQRRTYKKYNKKDVIMCVNNKCSNVSSSLEYIEKSVIDVLKELYKNYDFKFNINDKSDLNNVVKDLNNKLNLQKNKLNKIYSFFEEGIYDKNTFLKRKKIIEDSICFIEKEINIENEKNIFNKMNFKIEKNIFELYNKLNKPEDKNSFLKLFVEKIEYFKKAKNNAYNNLKLDIYIKMQY